MAGEVVEDEAVDYRSLADRLVAYQHDLTLDRVAFHLAAYIF